MMMRSESRKKKEELKRVLCELIIADKMVSDQLNKEPYDITILYQREEELTIAKSENENEQSTDQEEGIRIRIKDKETKEYYDLTISGYRPEMIKEKAIKKIIRLKGRKKGKERKKRNERREERGEESEKKMMTLIKKRLKKEKEGREELIREMINKMIDEHYEATGKEKADKEPLSKKIRIIDEKHRIIGKSRKEFPSIISAKIRYHEEREEKIHISEEEAKSQEITMITTAKIIFVRTEEGDVRYHYHTTNGHGLESAKETKEEILKEAEFAERIAKAKKIRPGKYTCVLSPHITGLLAHESFGHGMEADTIYKGRAKAEEYLGRKIADEKVSIIDYPLIPGKHGFYFFDDEGMTATKTYLLKNGVVNQPITDEYHSEKLRKKLLKNNRKKEAGLIKRTSNGRSQSYDHKTYARMSNTYFEEGEEDPEKLIKRVKEGYYLHNSSGGMEDPKGWGIQIQGVIAEKIKDGRLTGELFYEVGISGYLPTILKNIKGVSNNKKIEGTGFCGKGHKEWVRVSEGGPHLLIEEMSLS